MVKAMKENFAPYASSKSVVEVIKRFRERGLPDPVNSSALEQIGIPPTMTGITLQALVFLQLIDEGGNRTEAFERLRRASSDEYQGILAEIVRKAYLPVFTIVDPSQDNDIQVADAFRRFDPANQRDKMIRLFLGLCEESAIVQGRPSRVRKQRVKKEQTPNTSSTMTRKPGLTTGAAEFGKKEDAHEGNIGTDYRLISAIIQQLPHDAHWSAEKRKRWLEAMTSAVDLIIEVTETPGHEATASSANDPT